MPLPASPYPCTACSDPKGIHYDLEAAMARQASFLHNVLRAAYCEEPFLKRALDRCGAAGGCAACCQAVGQQASTHASCCLPARCRYMRYLVLWRENPGVTLVPMYDIDLMWHAHMAHSAMYQRDLLAFAGKVGREGRGLRQPTAACPWRSAFARRCLACRSCPMMTRWRGMG